jgi:hypothetical protein
MPLQLPDDVWDGLELVGFGQVIFANGVCRGCQGQQSPPHAA